MRVRTMAVVMVGAGVVPVSQAVADEPIAEEVITVVGTRTERSLDEVAATITVIDREQIEREMARDIQDLVRYEPGVSVGGTGSRFGLEGFTIRGIGGNRVLTVVDGIRVPEEFSFGPFLDSNRDFVDIDTLSRVEIARGPISTLYGSDALGGVVAFSTRSPDDYLVGQERFHAGLKTGYSSEDDSTVATLTTAGRSGPVAGLVSVTRRDASETETHGGRGGIGPEREEPDPMDITAENLAAKVLVDLAEGHRLTLGAELFDSETDSRILSDYGTLTRGTLVNRREADDLRERGRYTARYDYRSDDGLIDALQATLYRQTSDTEQRTFETRTPPGGPLQERSRVSRFEQEIEGAYLQLDRSFALGPTTHYVTLGGEYYETESVSLRDGGTVDPATGAPVREFLPLPTRDFPITTVTHQAVFLQNEVTLLDERLRVVPGVRWDEFDADPETDAIYLEGNPGSAQPAAYRDDAVTWKLGAVYQLTDGASVFARYSEGFRAPPFDDVNVGFSNFVGGYKSIANPDLESETSEGVELGVRFAGDWGNLQLAAFRTDYDNFIEPRAVAPAFLATRGIDPADGLLTFQSVNRDAVRIEGWEARGELALGVVDPALDALFVRGAFAYADGEDRETGAPIDTIDPPNAVLGLTWAPPQARWETELVWSWSADKDEDDIDADRLATDGWHVVDLLAHVDLTERISLDLGVFNLADERYIRWADTAAIGTDAPGRFTRPGRNYSATLRMSL